MTVIGVDTGGTFTDFIYSCGNGSDGPERRVYKVLSTPSNPAEAVLKGIEHIAAARGSMRIVHGSTVATNAILERKGAKTALVTNAGFEDIIEIGRQNRTRLYDLAYRKEPHLVPERLRFGVRGRILSSGEVLEELDEDGAREVLEKLRREGVESVAVCLLFSFVNPAHELALGKILADAGLPVSLSHQVLAEFREFERTSTTVLNACVSPVMKGYISRLCDSLDKGDTLRIMQSNGGSISAETAMSEPVKTILSGPAGGAVGAFELGCLAGYRRLITFDMGGTSTDVSLMDGDLSLTLESKISVYPVRIPMIDIHTVGAGGGSIAYVDEGGSLRVGPRSAGADPGPVCYGRGGRLLTVTDADLFLGRLIPERFLGGQMKLDAGALREHFADMGGRLGLTPVELAEGILSVADAAMERAIRVISVERGHDPGDFTLFAFGGAAGMHAAFLARLLNIPRVLVPRNPGILSALGMLMADMLKDYSLTVMRGAMRGGPEAKAEGDDELERLFAGLESRASRELGEEGIRPEMVRMERYLDMRYRGQSFEIIVPFGPDCVALFHREHEKTYGYRHDGRAVEIVNIRLRARGISEKPLPVKLEPSSPALPRDALIDALIDEREAVFDSKPVRVRVLDRDRLLCGNRIAGPAILVEYSSTIVIPPFAEAVVDEYGNLILEIR